MLEVMLAAAWMLAAPVCAPAGQDGPPPPAAIGVPRALLVALNAERRRAARPPLPQHPALCALAREIAERATGVPPGDMDDLRNGSRTLRRLGYEAHTWNAASLVGSWRGDSLLQQWAAVDREGWRRARESDAEHVGLALATRRGRPVLAVVLAVSREREAWRRVAPLRDVETVRRAVRAAVTRARVRAGLPPLEADASLDRIAQRHAADMAARGYYAHQDLDGSTVADRMRAGGHPACRRAAENIAKGVFTGEEVVDRWLDSPGHRRNILHRALTHTGVGVAVGEDEDGVVALWVQVFTDCGG